MDPPDDILVYYQYLLPHSFIKLLSCHVILFQVQNLLVITLVQGEFYIPFIIPLFVMQSLKGCRLHKLLFILLYGQTIPPIVQIQPFLYFNFISYCQLFLVFYQYIHFIVLEKLGNTFARLVLTSHYKSNLVIEINYFSFNFCSITCINQIIKFFLLKILSRGEHLIIIIIEK